MLKKLHIKVTLICTLITSIILVTSSVFINCYLEKQLNKNEYSKNCNFDLAVDENGNPIKF